MKIHEYQARDLFAACGLPTQQSEVASTPDEAAGIARRYGKLVVVKAQVHAGGRGKAGGVKLARTPDEARERAEARLSGVGAVGGALVTDVIVTGSPDPP